jgi:ADP-heptose:LPS heptosyltransferase
MSNFNYIKNLAGYDLPDFKFLHKFLILDTQGRGDSIMNTAFYRELRNYVGKDKIIDIFTYNEEVLEYCPYINNNIKVNHDLENKDYIDISNSYDLIVFTQNKHNIFAEHIFKNSKCKYKYSYSNCIKNKDIKNYLSHSVDTFDQYCEHNVITSLKLLSYAGIDIKTWYLEHWTNDDIINYKFEKDYIVLCPWGSQLEQNINIEYVIEFIKLFIVNEPNYNIILIGSFDKIDESILIKGVVNNENLINMIGKTSFNEYAYLIKNSKFLITCNTSSTHLASAYKIPTVDCYHTTYNHNDWKMEFTRKSESWCTPHITLHGYTKFNINGNSIYSAFNTLKSIIE